MSLLGAPGLGNQTLKNGQGGLVGGEGGGKRKAEICSFRCLPTTKVQVRQLCFRMNLSAHAKKTYFWLCFVQSMFSFVFLFFAKSKELSVIKLERCSHGKREILQNRLKILQRDGKLENEEGFSQISHGDARLNNEEKQESALPSLDSGESLRRTHL